MPRARAEGPSAKGSSSEAQTNVPGSPMLFEWLLAAALVVLPLTGGKAAVAGSAPPTGPAAVFYWLRAFSPDACLTVFSLTALLAWATASFRRGKLGVICRPYAHLPAVLFCLWALCSLRWTLSLHGTLPEAARRAGQVLFFLLAVQAVGRGRGGFLAWGVTTSAGLQGLLAVREYAATYIAGDPTWRVFGTLPNPNVLASFLLTALPVALGLCVTASKPLQIAAGGAVLVQLAGLLLTGSRGGWLAAGVALVCWLAFCARHIGRAGWRRLGVLAVLCAVVVPVASLPLRSRVERAGAPAQVASNRFRLLTWSGTMEAIRERPLIGAGAGTFEVLYPPHAKAGFTRTAHNSYLQLAAELGAVGLALWLWMVGAALWTGLPGKGAPQAPLLRFSAAAGMVGSAAHNVVDYGWYVPAAAVLFWICTAFSGGMVLQTPGERRRTVPLLSMVGLAAVSAPLLSFGVGDLLAVSAEHKASLPAKLAAYQSAIRWNPLDPELHSDYAAVLAWGGRPDLALQEFRRLTEQEPNRANLRYRYALALERSGMPEQALVQYERSIRLDPTATAPLIAAANIHLSSGRTAQAEKLYRRITELEDSPVATVKALEDFGDPNYAEAHLALAKIHISRGEKDDARREALNGLRSAHIALAGLIRWRSVQQAVGRYDEARERRLLHVRDELQRIAGPPVM